MTAIYIALTVKIHYEPKMRKIIFHKFFLIFIHLGGILEKYFIWTEEMLRHTKIDVSFSRSFGTDMPIFMPWLMD